MLETREAATGELGPRFKIAATTLVDLILLWRCCGPLLSLRERQDSFDIWNRFLSVTEDMVEIEQPKRHITAHLLQKTAWFGNPCLYHCFLDESDNRLLKAACRTVSQETFEPFLLLRMLELMASRSRGRPFGR